ncbi:GntR family transcriptional regulator [Planomonospora parontospora subsp. parontospora]|uniref:GntR family transcriptional regulator n=2 Tax=Planomonospora parontospora TaxID=58119 RepID=A0AA37F6P2_9ACTN|nr:PLP-dependent aminotransferase family protein [Planomonospora parontospora]GGK86649.1 GntR family transcriptional regulator [Planomonospora parontospora]GII10816.1 GntR family transcriptional regulator [Planomonospora parontospora subsp. parontospora]
MSLGGRGDLTARIYRQIRDAVLDGRLRAGERLPSTRELAGRLGVSRNTVALAYERLSAEGFLAGRAGAGTFVCDGPPGRTFPRSASEGGARRDRGLSRSAPENGVRPRAPWASVPAADAPPWAPGAPAFDFGVGAPDPSLFPLEAWRRIVTRELRRKTIASAGYGDPAGHAGLREAIARHAGVARSVRAGADDVIVTQGAQQALDLVGRVMVGPGDLVAVEEPGYPPARLLFRSLGARVTGVPVDDEGIDVAAIPDAARLVYVTPSHQFPLGVPMSPARRTALLAWAERRDAVVVEDDYDSEFRFGARPLEPLQSLDRAGRVVYVGSFSKTLLPALRLGFLVAPASLRAALHAAKRLTDWHGDLLTQAALARFMEEGLLARHVRRATREYAVRRELIVTSLRRDFSGLLRPVDSAAGLHLCARFLPGAAADPDRVVSRAREAGIAVEPLSGYHAEPPGRPGLVIGYGAIPPERIEPGLRRLAECFREAAR